MLSYKSKIMLNLIKVHGILQVHQLALP
jgi:hypothetical protein